MSVNTQTPKQFAPWPTVTSSVIAVIAAAGAVGLLASTIPQRRLLALTIIGACCFGLGGRLRLQDRQLTGVSLMTIGTLVVALAVSATMVAPAQLSHRIELLPGLVGLWLLVAGLIPLRAAWSRRLIDLGTGLLFAGVLTSGVLRSSSTVALVVAAAATILAWDAAQNAVSIGGQVGSTAASSRVELFHVAFTSAVALIAIVVVVGLTRLGVDGLPFATLLALVIAAILFALGSHE